MEGRQTVTLRLPLDAVSVISRKRSHGVRLDAAFDAKKSVVSRLVYTACCIVFAASYAELV